MAVSPSTGDRAFQPFRGSVSVPHRELSLHEKAGLDRSDADAQVYFTHPSVRIYTFSPSVDPAILAKAPNLPDTDYPVDTIETLPWRSRTEICAARGEVVIEKIRGSTKFLKCGSFVQVIMRNSQCWCVDGQSIFVLRTGRFKYNRLELPTATDEDKQKVEELKLVLATLLRFESTPCPFQRGFHVDLPDDAITPRRKGAWKRRASHQPTAADADSPITRNPRRTWTYQTRSVTAPHLSSRSRDGSESSATSSRDPSPVKEDGSTGLRTRSATPSSIASEEQYERRLSGVGSASGDRHRNQITDPSPIVEVNDPRPVSQSGESASSKVRGMIQRFNIEPPLLPVRQERLPKTSPDFVDKRDVESSSKEHDAVQSIASQVESTTEDHDTFTGENTDIAGVDTTNNIQNVVHSQIDTDTQDEADIGVILKKTEQDLASVDGTAEYDDGSNKNETEDLLPRVVTIDDPGDMVTPSSVHGKDTKEDDILSMEKTNPATSSSIEPLLQTAAPHQNVRIEKPDMDLDQRLEAINTALMQVHEAGVMRAHEKEADGSSQPGQQSVIDTMGEELLSRVSSRDSFRSAESVEFQSPIKSTINTPIEDSFPGYRSNHKRDISELTVTASTVGDQLEHETASDSIDPDETPVLGTVSGGDRSWSEIQSTPASNFPEIQDGLRRRANHITQPRSLSPLPSSTNIYSPTTSVQSSIISPAILQRAAHLALVKPVELVYLVFHILSRIAGGATMSELLSGELFRRPDQTQPHRRSSSFPDHLQMNVRTGELDEDDEDNDERPLEEEDDFGVPLRGRQGSIVKPPNSRTGPTKPSTRGADSDSLFDLD